MGLKFELMVCGAHINYNAENIPFYTTRHIYHTNHNILVKLEISILYLSTTKDNFNFSNFVVGYRWSGLTGCTSQQEVKVIASSPLGFQVGLPHCRHNLFTVSPCTTGVLPSARFKISTMFQCSICSDKKWKICQDNTSNPPSEVNSQVLSGRHSIQPSYIGTLAHVCMCAPFSHVEILACGEP